MTWSFWEWMTGWLHTAISAVFSTVEAASPKDGWGTAFVTAGLGAFVGGWFSARALTKRSVIAELRALSAAQTLAYWICNRCLTVKSQHVVGMQARFKEVSRRHKAFLKLPEATRGQFKFVADFQTLAPLNLPVDELKKTILEKTTVRGRGLVSLIELVSSSVELDDSIKERTSLSIEIRDRKDKSDTTVAELYMGLPSKGGHRDERYPSNLFALGVKLDECIYFSLASAVEIRAYTNQLRRLYLWRHWLWFPKMSDSDLSKAIEANLIPTAKEFEKWEVGFTRLIWWKRILRRISP